jgi:hypothetical protein
MIQFNEAALVKLLKVAILTTLREYHKQNKNISIGEVSITHTDLNPPGIKYRFVVQANVLHDPENKEASE